MADQEKSARSSDPFEPFRALRDAYLDSMAKTMVEAVNTETYAQASGAMLEGALSASAPFREAIEKSMTQALQQLSLPSRQEVAALAERFTQVEMRLDDMDAKLDRIDKRLRAASHTEPEGGATVATPRATHTVSAPQAAPAAAAPEESNAHQPKAALRRMTLPRKARRTQR